MWESNLRAVFLASVLRWLLLFFFPAVFRPSLCAVLCRLSHWLHHWLIRTCRGGCLLRARALRKRWWRRRVCFQIAEHPACLTACRVLLSATLVAALGEFSLTWEEPVRCSRAPAEATQQTISPSPFQLVTPSLFCSRLCH